MEESPRIIFDDQHFIAVIKPAGLLVQKDSKSDDDSLYDIVKRRLGGGFCGMVHRLDKLTEGIVVFAKTPEAAAALSAQIRDHEPVKTYMAVVEGVFKEKKGRLSHYLLKKELKAQVFSVPKPGAKTAELEYEVIESRDGRSLLRISLLTGRYNQIRAQMAYVRHPVVGDEKYKGSNGQIGSIALAATGFGFVHPFTGKQVDLAYEWEFPAWKAGN